MGDVLTPKRQTVVDRLKRRFDHYRRHQNESVPRYEQAANCLYESQRQDTIVLKQRFLESKAKKAKSKNDHHRSYKDTVTDGSKTQLHSKPLKRSAEDPIPNATPEITGNDESEKASKIPRVEPVPEKPAVPDLLQSQQTNQQSIIPTFSVQIVQQFSQSPLHQTSQTIQTNVTVQQTLPKPQTPVANNNSKQPEQPSSSAQEDLLQTTAPSMGNVECKQEQDTGEPDLCQFKNTSQVSNNSVGDRLSDTFPSIEFTDESGETVIHPDLLNDLIEDVFTNSGDIMKDFNFEDSVGSLKDQDGAPKDILDFVKGTSPNPLKPFQADTLSFVNTPPNTHSPNGLFRNIPVTSEAPISSVSPSPVTTSSTFFNTTASQRLPTFANSANRSLPNGLGLEFKLTEPSPAALTLKQMAEQHQNMQVRTFEDCRPLLMQKQQQQQLVSPSISNRPQPFNQGAFNPHINSLRPNFLNGPGAAIQNSSPKIQNSNTNIFNTFEQCINSFSNDEPPTTFPNCDPLTPNNMFPSEIRPRNPAGIVDPLQMKMAGHSIEQQQNPPAYGATQPLTHFADNSIRHQNLVSNQQQQQQRPIGRQLQNNQGMQIQMNQIQQMQPRQQIPQQQLQQNHRDIKPQQQQQQHSIMQQHLNVYRNYTPQQPVNNPTFQVSMSQSLTFSAPFNANATLNRPPPEYKAAHHRNVLPDNMHLVEQLNAPSQVLFNQTAKSKYSKQLPQRPPNVTITPDGSAISSSHDWRNNIMNSNNHQQQNQFRINHFPVQDNYNNLSVNGPANVAVPLSPMYNQYRMPGNQNMPNRLVRPNRVPQGSLVMQQRQRMAIPPRSRNPMPVLEQHTSMTMNNNAISSSNILGPMYAESQDIERQDGSHLNFDFLDNIESTASDLLNFDQVIQGPPFPILDDMDILGK